VKHQHRGFVHGSDENRAVVDRIKLTPPKRYVDNIRTREAIVADDPHLKFLFGQLGTPETCWPCAVIPASTPFSRHYNHSTSRTRFGIYVVFSRGSTKPTRRHSHNKTKFLIH
jgi:hypothetical protein